MYFRFDTSSSCHPSLWRPHSFPFEPHEICPSLHPLSLTTLLPMSNSASQVFSYLPIPITVRVCVDFSNSTFARVRRAYAVPIAPPTLTSCRIVRCSSDHNIGVTFLCARARARAPLPDSRIVAPPYLDVHLRLIITTNTMITIICVCACVCLSTHFLYRS